MKNWQQRAKLWLHRRWRDVRRWRGVRRWLRRNRSKILIVAVAAVALAALTTLPWPTIQREVGSGTYKLSRFGAAVIVAVIFSARGALTYGLAKKSLWQLSELLKVPLALAVIGFWFTGQQEVRQNEIEKQRAQQAQKIENQRAAAEQELAEQRAQDEALQAYLDKLSELILQRDLLEAEVGDPAYTLAQARTSTVILRLDAEHNESVIRFLSDSGLTGRGESSVSLLRGIALSGADLSGADLTDADLYRANLTNTYLNVADLSGADFTNATVTQEQLYRARSLEGATMPNGREYEN